MNWIECSEIKREARNSLSGRWGQVVGTFFIGWIVMLISNITNSFVNKVSTMTESSLVMMMSAIIAIVFSIISSLLTVIMEYGYCDFSLKIAQNEKSEITDIFTGFRRIVKLLVLWLVKGIGFGILSLPLYAAIIISVAYVVLKNVPALAEGQSKVLLNNEFISKMMAGIGVVFIIGVITAIISIVLNIFISQTCYILRENQSEGIFKCIKKSFKMMKGHIWNYIVLNLSFIGWGILCIFTLGIGLLWLKPYTQISKANFYLKIKELNVE